MSTKPLWRDNHFAYLQTDDGIMVAPHSGEWRGYYRVGEFSKLILVALSEGDAPGELTIPIRSWEDLKGGA